jgi:hypothetical protein
MVDVVVRPVRSGDAGDLARGWIDGARYYAELDPGRFQVPSDEGLVEWMTAAIRRPTPRGRCCAISTSPACS